MNEDNQGMVGRNTTGSNQIQSREKTGGSFFQNGFEHFPIPTGKVVTVGFLLGMLYFIGNIISGYELATSKVHKIIDEYVPLNKRLDKTDWRLDDLEADMADIKQWKEAANGYLKAPAYKKPHASPK